MDKLKAGQRALGFHTGSYTELPKGDIFVKLENIASQPDYSNEEILKHFEVPSVAVDHGRIWKHVEALQQLLNEKDEQIDKLSRPMIVRLDWWTIGIVALVFGAHYFGYM